MSDALTRIWVIALNTFRETVRDKILAGVLGVGAALLLFSLVIAELSLGESMRVLTDLGVATVSLVSVVIAIFLGSSLLAKEIELKTLYVILPKPIRRQEFLLGKYLGIVLTATVFIAIMWGVEFFVIAFRLEVSRSLLFGLALLSLVTLGVLFWKVQDSSAGLVGWALLVFGIGAMLVVKASGPVVPLLWFASLAVLEVFLLAAVAMLFSSFSTPFLTGLMTFGVWVLGRQAEEMANVQSRMLPEALRDLLHVFGRVVPNFQLFVPPRRLLFEGAGNSAFEYVASSAGYGFVYAAGLLLVSIWLFGKRDFV